MEKRSLPLALAPLGRQRASRWALNLMEPECTNSPNRIDHLIFDEAHNILSDQTVREVVAWKDDRHTAIVFGALSGRVRHVKGEFY